MPSPARTDRLPSRISIGLAVATVAAHVAVNLFSPYGLHRDAFLYLAMGERLRLFAMDFPPFIALLAEATRWLLGDGITAIRAGPAVAHGLLVLLAARAARFAGGGGWAQAVAAVSVATAPLYLRAGTLFQPVIFDQLWWSVGFLALIRIGHLSRGRAAGGERLDAAEVHEDPRSLAATWLVLGLVLGLGLLTKFTILVFAVGALVGLLLTPGRRQLATPWPWLAAALALLVGLPSLVGQIALDVPVLGQLADLEATQLSRVSPGDFLLGQALQIGPAISLAVVGVGAAVVDPRRRGSRTAAWTAISALVILLVVGGKAYYAGPLYPVFIGVGATFVEAWAGSLAERGRRRIAVGVKGACAALILGWAALTFPLGVPVVSPPAMARYAERLGVTEAVTTNTGRVLRLPQDYADMLGWEDLVAEAATVWNGLPPADRSRAVLLAANYGEAGALDFYGPRHGLPRAVAPVGSYWFFGPGDRTGEVTVAVGIEPDALEAYFESTRLAARVENPWGVPEEQDVPIVVARGPYRSLQEVWPDFRGAN